MRRVNCRAVVGMAPNDEVERRGVGVPTNEDALSQSSIPSLAQRRRGPVIARTDC
jgi:hypothetical protein